MVVFDSTSMVVSSLSSHAAPPPSDAPPLAAQRRSNGPPKSSSSDSRPSVSALVLAAKFSKKLVSKRLSTMTAGMSMSGSSKTHNDNKMGDHSSSATFATDRRQSWRDPVGHLKTILTSDSSPFLSSFLDSPLPAPSYSKTSLELGQLLADGAFAQVQEVTSTKTSRSLTNTPQTQPLYALKSLPPRLWNNDDDSEEDHCCESLERAATQLVLEGLYLAHLHHPHIVALRGVAVGGLAAPPDQLFLLTDRLGETLDQRLETWKQAKGNKAQRKRQRRDSYFHTKDADKLLPTSYPEDLIALKTNYALQILQALQYLHERGIVVRELRPEGIGFGLVHPHHVQLCDLSACREVPRDGRPLPPEPFSLEDFNNNGSHKSEDPTIPSTTQHSLWGVRTSAAARRYMAPELLASEEGSPGGYGTKADLYSWAMIFAELVTETKPYSSRQLQRDWTKITKGQLRPKLQKYYFPRTLKAVLERAWQANVDKRATAQQLSQSLATILHMLEGQTLPWLLHMRQRQQQRQSPPLPQHSRCSSKTTQPPPSNRTTLAVASAQFTRTNSVTTLANPLSLPERAGNYKRWQAKQRSSVPWASVWDPRAKSPLEGPKADGIDIQASVQSNKEQVFQRRYKANRIEGI